MHYATMEVMSHPV